MPVGSCRGHCSSCPVTAGLKLRRRDHRVLFVALSPFFNTNTRTERPVPSRCLQRMISSVSRPDFCDADGEVRETRQPVYWDLPWCLRVAQGRGKSSPRIRSGSRLEDGTEYEYAMEIPQDTILLLREWSLLDVVSLGIVEVVEVELLVLGNGGGVAGIWGKMDSRTIYRVSLRKAQAEQNRDEDRAGGPTGRISHETLILIPIGPRRRLLGNFDRGTGCRVSLGVEGEHRAQSRERERREESRAEQRRGREVEGSKARTSNAEGREEESEARAAARTAGGGLDPVQYWTYCTPCWWVDRGVRRRCGRGFCLGSGSGSGDAEQEERGGWRRYLHGTRQYSTVVVCAGSPGYPVGYPVGCHRPARNITPA